jgi:hypothetical protein
MPAQRCARIVIEEKALRKHFWGAQRYAARATLRSLIA